MKSASLILFTLATLLQLAIFSVRAQATPVARANTASSGDTSSKPKSSELVNSPTSKLHFLQSQVETKIRALEAAIRRTIQTQEREKLHETFLDRQHEARKRLDTEYKHAKTLQERQEIRRRFKELDEEREEFEREMNMR